MTEQRRAFGWLSATAPLWPLGLARILYGILWWQQSKWKVASDDFGTFNTSDSRQGIDGPLQRCRVAARGNDDRDPTLRPGWHDS